MRTSTLHGVVELELTSSRDYANALHDQRVWAELTAPSGKPARWEAFWDGGPTWRVRVSPDEVGRWSWRIACEQPGDSGLDGAAGEFDVEPYAGDNPLYLHGPLRVKAGGTFLEHADGTPFFWLGDTPWNGVLRGTDAAWEEYLTVRAGQRFSVVQVVTTHWRGCPAEQGGMACTEEYPAVIDPAFFQRLDRRMAMINEHGLVAAPVVLWSLLKSDIGYKLDERDAIAVARYIVARYGAGQVVWLLGGDGNYQEMGVDRWQRLGRAVFDGNTRRLATLHPCGINWVGEEFRHEPWYDLIGYQSGHGDGDDDLRWLVQGPPATAWNHAPVKPVINLEPNYESPLYGYQHHTSFTDYHVRRGAWWSLLVSPTAGLTYGNTRIWTWNDVTGPSPGHGGIGHARVTPWYTGLRTEGTESMAALRDIVDGWSWWQLRPAPELLADQPGERTPGAFIAAARAIDGSLTVIYTPCGGKVALTGPLAGNVAWLNPANGAARPATWLDGGYSAPDELDWLLVAASR